MKKPKGGRPKRVVGKRETKKVVRVLAEGSVTERQYLSKFARRHREVHLDWGACGMVPLSLVQRARTDQRISPRDFDEIWCVFDVDEHPNLAQALNEARQSDISVALSNPCFELWLILHYEDHTAPIDRHDAQNRAEALGAVAGKSLDPGNVEDLIAGCEKAKHRSQTLRSRHIANGSPPDANPSSNVWELLDCFR